MIPEWYRLKQTAERLERKPGLDPVDLQRLHSALISIQRTRNALGKQHPMEQTEAYRRLKAECDRLG